MWTMNNVLGLVGLTLRSPQEGASSVLALSLPRPVVWQILLLITVVSVLLAQLTLAMLVSSTPSLAADMLFLSPFVAVMVHGGTIVLTVFAIFWIGRLFGGKGAFEETLALVTWLQFVFVLLQVVQTLAFLVDPTIADLLGLVAIGLFFWLLTNFVAVLHGFSSLGLVFAGIIGSAFAIALALVFLFTIIGLSMPGLENV